MPPISLTGLALVAGAAFIVPLLLGLAPRLPLPSQVLEIVVGIVIGPAALGWVRVDLPLQVFALLGLAFLLFLAGLEVEFDRFKGTLLRLSGASYLLSACLALLVGYLLAGTGQVRSPLFIAIALGATALGIVIPVLKDAGELASDLGQLVTTNATLGEFGSIILLSLFFSGRANSAGATLILLGWTALAAVLVFLLVSGVERTRRLSAELLRLQATTAEIRVRGAFLLLVAFAALAERLGLEVILGAFIAGALLSLLDPDRAMTHPMLRPKLEAIGFGIFVPAFFVVTGVRFDLGALLASPATVARVPLFLAALVVVRGLPAALFRPRIGGRRATAAALLQSTTLSFLVPAVQIGQALKVISPATGAALVAAGLLSVLLFPLAALILLRGAAPAAQLERGGPPAPLGAIAISSSGNAGSRLVGTER